MPVRNYTLPFLKGVLAKHHCILKLQGPHYFIESLKMSATGDHEEVLDFEYEEEVEDHPDKAQDAGINHQHLKLTECEAESMEEEAEANSTPGILGADALPEAPTKPA